MRNELSQNVKKNLNVQNGRTNVLVIIIELLHCIVPIYSRNHLAAIEIDKTLLICSN